MGFLLHLLQRIPSLLTGLVQSLLPCGHSVQIQEEPGLAQDLRLVTIHELPDDVLLEIFNFYANIDRPLWFTPRITWSPLVHVCRRWRYVVFASPRRLNLRLVYRGHRPMSEMLDAWPVLPVSLQSSIDPSDRLWDNTVAALESEHINCICDMDVYVTNSRWERFAAAMQKPFPELTDLHVWAFDAVPVLPDSFLGGSAPLLRTLQLTGIPFPSLPKLLSSATRLVKLDLWYIPNSGYIAPDAMATALAAMTSLESFDLRLLSPRSRPDLESRPLSPPTCLLLPALTRLRFKGVYNYLEDLLARVDIPYLSYLLIEFSMILDFDVPQLRQLIGHAEEFMSFDRADVLIDDDSIQLHLYPNTGSVDRNRRLELGIRCKQFGSQLSSLSQVCSSSIPIISAVEELHVMECVHSWLYWKGDTESARWLELLDSFTTLRNLYLTDRIAQHICGALQELSGERATEVLPALRNLFVRGSSLEPVEEAIKSFITTRELSGHPVVVDRWKK